MTKQKSFWTAALALLCWAILLRFPTFGNPILDFDEAWYLYGGGQLLRGYLPYVGFWDRKPFGIFLLYAPFYLFGTYRFLAYQIAALCFIWGTALFIFKMAQRFSGFFSSLLAGMLYLSLAQCLSGFGGQTPVFYNLLTAASVCILLERFKTVRLSPALLRRTGIEIMFLMGLALELKPAVVFEGIFFGCFLLWICWRYEKNLPRLLANFGLWVGTALLPTCFVAGFYVFIGHFQEWYFANIFSVFLRKAEIFNPNLFILLGLGAGFLFTLLFTLTLNFKHFSARKKSYFRFILLWLVVAFTAVLLTPPYFSHYFLSLALPFALFTAFAASSSRLGKILLSIAVLISAIAGEGVFFHLRHLHPEQEYFDIQKIVKSHPESCLFEYGASVTMLDLTPFMSKNCHLTKYIFPSHLGSKDDTGAMGIGDEMAELAHVLAQKPTFILIGRKYFIAYPFDIPSLYNKKNKLMRDTLRKDYHLIYKRNASERLELYERNEAP